jgi:hypothetical protein
MPAYCSGIPTLINGSRNTYAIMVVNIVIVSLIRPGETIGVAFLGNVNAGPFGIYSGMDSLFMISPVSFPSQGLVLCGSSTIG